jgi:hypothetical protein
MVLGFNFRKEKVMSITSKNMRSRAIAIIAVLAMVLSLFATTTTTAFAAPPAPVTAPSPFSGGTGTQADPYLIGSWQDLSQLATDVNGGYPYTGNYFMQIADIDLSSVAPWQPIGYGEGTTSGSMPFGGYYSGYDTNKSYFNTLYNLNLTAPKSLTGVGLFGNVTTGQIANVTLSGGSVSFTGAGNYVGAIVGYSNGSVINCRSNVEVYAPGSANVGGLVGALEDQTKEQLTNQVLIQYCKSSAAVSGDVTGQSRVGGIVGSVYAAFPGNVAVDNCEYTSGTIQGTRTSQNVYAGGVVGYCQGWVSNSYAYDIALNSSGGGYYFGGVAGLLQGDDPIASLYNSYSHVSKWAGTNPSYDRPLVSRVDNSYTLPLSNDIWTEEGAPGYYQPESDPGASGWGDWLGDTNTVGSNPAALNTNINTLNSDSSNPSPYIPAYTVGPTNPLLTWEVSTTPRVYYPLPYSAAWTPGGIPEHPGGDDEDQIFFDPNGPAGNGDYDTPTNSWTTALNLVSGSRDIIYFISTMDVTSPLSINSPGATLVRSGNKGTGGYLFDVSSILTLSNVTIDGDSEYYYPGFVSSSLIHLNSGAQVTINGGVILQNNYASNGGAIRSDGGAIEMNNGLITQNRADLNGGAVAVYADSKFLLNGGTLSGNVANQDGGAIAAYTGSIVTISQDSAATSITGNSAPNGHGGGIVSGSGGNVDIVDGTISGNSAVSGGGVAVKGTGTGASAGALTMSGGTIGGSGTANTATVNGGGVYIYYYGTFGMTGGTISYNTAGAGGGGGVALYGASSASPCTFTMSGSSTISNNSATGQGGGVFVNDDSVFNINGGSITNNTATTNGGDISIIPSGAVTMTSGTISENTATGLGSGVYDGNQFTITPSTAPFNIFTILDVIYLAGNHYINVGAALPYSIGTLTIQCANPADDLVVASGSAYTLVNNDVNRFAYVGSAWSFYLDSGANTINIESV